MKVSVISTRQLGKLLRQLGLAVLIFGLGPFASSWAEPSDGQKFDDWTARCNEEQLTAMGTKCFIFQSVLETEQQRTVLMFVIGQPPDDPEPRAMIVVPIGIVDLRPGIEMVVDGGAPRRYPFVVCFQDGCQAHMKVDDELLGAFKKGIKGTIAYRLLPGGQSVKIPFSLKGFSAGLSSLQ